MAFESNISSPENPIAVLPSETVHVNSELRALLDSSSTAEQLESGLEVLAIEQAGELAPHIVINDKPVELRNDGTNIRQVTLTDIHVAKEATAVQAMDIGKLCTFQVERNARESNAGTEIQRLQNELDQYDRLTSAESDFREALSKAKSQLQEQANTIADMFMSDNELSRADALRNAYFLLLGIECSEYSIEADAIHNEAQLIFENAYKSQLDAKPSDITMNGKLFDSVSALERLQKREKFIAFLSTLDSNDIVYLRKAIKDVGIADLAKSFGEPASKPDTYEGKFHNKVRDFLNDEQNNLDGDMTNAFLVVPDGHRIDSRVTKASVGEMYGVLKSLEAKLSKDISQHQRYVMSMLERNAFYDKIESIMPEPEGDSAQKFDALRQLVVDRAQDARDAQALLEKISAIRAPETSPLSIELSDGIPKIVSVTDAETERQEREQLQEASQSVEVASSTYKYIKEIENIVNKDSDERTDEEKDKLAKFDKDYEITSPFGNLFGGLDSKRETKVAELKQQAQDYYNDKRTALDSIQEKHRQSAENRRALSEMRYAPINTALVRIFGNRALGGQLVVENGSDTSHDMLRLQLNSLTDGGGTFQLSSIIGPLREYLTQVEQATVSEDRVQLQKQYHLWKDKFEHEFVGFTPFPEIITGPLEIREFYTAVLHAVPQVQHKLEALSDMKHNEKEAEGRVVNDAEADAEDNEMAEAGSETESAHDPDDVLGDIVLGDFSFAESSEQSWVRQELEQELKNAIKEMPEAVRSIADSLILVNGWSGLRLLLMDDANLLKLIGRLEQIDPNNR